MTAAAIGVLTPWRLLDGAVDVQPTPAADFSPAEVARAAAFRADLGPWPYVAYAATLLLPWVVVLGAWRWRRGTDPGRASQGRHRRWPLQAGTAAGVLVAQVLVSLPFDIHTEVVLRRWGLSTQSWAGWSRDAGVGLATSVAVTSVAVIGVLYAVRRLPRRWPYAVAAAAAAFVTLGSAAYPLVVEPLYNTFTPLPQDALTRRIEALAAEDGLPDIRVVASDASVRTTGENAHVSGLGATRWVVLDDTLLARAGSDPDAVVAVVAHELGHAVHGDIARGTAIGSAGAASTVLLLAAAAQGRRGRGLLAPRTRSPSHAVLAAALVVAVAGTAPFLASPVTNLVSRRIEAAADVHALDRTQDPQAFVRMQRNLAVTNLSRLEPTWWQTMLFASHPSPPWRIALARAWVEARG